MCKGSIFTSFALAIESEPASLVPFLLSSARESSVPRGFLTELSAHLEGADEDAMLVSIFVPILKSIVQSCRSFRLMDSFVASGKALKMLTSVPEIAKLVVTRAWVIKDPTNFQFSLLSDDALEVRRRWGTYPGDCFEKMSGRDMIWTFLGCLMDLSTIGDQAILRQYFATPSKRKAVDVRRDSVMLRHKLGSLRGELSGICNSFSFFLSFLFSFFFFLFSFFFFLFSFFLFSFLFFLFSLSPPSPLLTSLSVSNLLRHKITRMAVLDWVSIVIHKNKPRLQLQNNDQSVSGDSFLLNLAGVMLKVWTTE